MVTMQSVLKFVVSTGTNVKGLTDKTRRGVIKGQFKIQSMDLPGKDKNFTDLRFQVSLSSLEFN